MFFTRFMSASWAVCLPFKNKHNAWGACTCLVKVRTLPESGAHFIRVCFHNEKMRGRGGRHGRLIHYLQHFLAVC